MGSGQPDALRNRLGAHSSKDQSLASVVVVDFISGLILFPGTVLPVAMTPEQLDSVLHCLSPVSYTHLDVYKRQAEKKHKRIK